MLLLSMLIYNFNLGISSILSTHLWKYFFKSEGLVHIFNLARYNPTHYCLVSSRLMYLRFGFVRRVESNHQSSSIKEEARQISASSLKGFHRFREILHRDFSPMHPILHRRPLLYPLELRMHFIFWLLYPTELPHRLNKIWYTRVTLGSITLSI